MFGEIQRRWTLWDIFRRVRKHGWTGVHVPGDAEQSSFAYSVGFREFAAAPEVIMFGTAPEASNALLSEISRQLKAGELGFEDQAPWNLDWGEERGPTLAWRAVHPSQIRREHFNLVIIKGERQGAARSDIRAYQLFFSDTAGKLPWQDGFDRDYKPRQPKLYLPYFGGEPD